MAPTPPPWQPLERSEEFHLPGGRGIVKGDELHTSWLRGRWRFIEHVSSGKDEWLDVWGPLGQRSRPKMRSIPCGSVTRVHRSRTVTRS